MRSHGNHTPFDILFEGVDGETLQAVEQMFNDDLVAMANDCEDGRGLIGSENHGDHRAIPGDLALRPALRVHPMDYFAQRFHGEDWRDPGLQSWFAKRNDYARVKCVGSGKIMVGYGSKADGATKRFSKSYG
jgi:hypothetical protein